MCVVVFIFFFFKQKTAYEMRISDWSSDVCSSDLFEIAIGPPMKVNDVAGPRCKDHEFSGCLVGCIQPEIAHRSVPLLTFDEPERSEERRVGKSVSVRVDLGGRRIIKIKIQ